MAKHGIFDEVFRETLPVSDEEKFHFSFTGVDERTAVQPYRGPGGRLLYGVFFSPNECGLVTPVPAGDEKEPVSQVIETFRKMDELAYLNAATPVAVSLNIRTRKQSTEEGERELLKMIAEVARIQAIKRNIGVVDYDHVVTDRMNVDAVVNATFLSGAGKALANLASDSCISWNVSQRAEITQGLNDGTILSLPGDVDLPKNKQDIERTIVQLGERFIAVKPEGRVVGMKADSLGHKAALFSVIDQCGRAGNDVFAMAADPCLEEGTVPRALVVFSDHVGGRRFEDLETSVIDLGKKLDISPHLVYAAHPERLEGFYKRGPMFFVDSSVITLHNVAQGNGIMKKLRWLERKDRVYAVRGMNPRLCGMEDILRVLQAKNGGRNWPKLEDSKFMLREFYARSLPPLYGALASLKSDGNVKAVFLPSSEGSAVYRFAKALRTEELDAQFSGLKFHPVEEFIQYYCSRNRDLQAIDEDYAVRNWPLNVLGIVVVGKGFKLEKCLQGFDCAYVGDIRGRSAENGGLKVTAPSGVELYLP